MPLQMLNVVVMGVALGLGFFAFLYGLNFRHWKNLGYFAFLSLVMILYSGSHAALCTAEDVVDVVRYFRLADMALFMFFGALPLLYRQLTSEKAGWVEHAIAIVYGGFCIANGWMENGLGWGSFTYIGRADLGILGQPSDIIFEKTPLTYPMLAIHFFVVLYCTRITWSAWMGRRISKLLLMVLPLCSMLFIVFYVGSIMRLWLLPYALSPVIGSLLYIGLGLTVFEHLTRVKLERELLILNLSEREKTLKASESRWRQLFDGAADMLFLCDAEGRIRDANASCCLTLGYGVDELQTLKIWDLEQDLSLTSFQSRWEKVSREGALLLETQSKCKDGRWFPAEMRVIPFVYGSEQLLFMSSRDITWRVAQEADRARMAEQLRSSSKLEAIGRLAGSVAHDFRNLLTVMQANLDLLRWEADGEKKPKCLDSLGVAITRATALTQQLLTFSHHHFVETRLLSLKGVISEMEVLLRHCLREDISIKFDLAEVEDQVRLDPNAFEQVLINLAVNARDAMPEGGTFFVQTRPLHVDASFAVRHPAMALGDYLVLTVQDNGHGMTSEIRERIFDPFFSTKPKGKGTGLGLAMVFGVIQQMGGCIEVESEPDQGTRFHIYLPAVKGDPDVAPLLEPFFATAPGVKADPGWAQNKTVLLVEDETAVREAGESILSRMGYRVLAVGSGDEALARYLERGQDIDLLLSDVIMPGLNGRELADRWTQAHPETPVLFVSGYTDNILQGNMLEESGAFFLEKPYSRESLEQKLNQIWNKILIARPE